MNFNLEKPLSSFKGTFRSMKDVNEFLFSSDMNKDNNIRFLAYLTKFKVIKPTTNNKLLAKMLINSIQSYRHNKERVLGNNFQNPFSIVSKKTAFVINADIERSIYWFLGLMRNIFDIKIGENEIFAIKESMKCIFSIYDSTNEVKYIQGSDRFGFAIFALALNFSFTVLHISDIEFIESLCGILIKEILVLVDLNSTLVNGCDTRTFRNLNTYIETNYSPEYKAMKELNQDSFLFAVRWKLVFFSDEVDITKIFNVWDLLFAKKEHIDDMFLSLCEAHVDDYKRSNKTNGNIVAKIFSFKSWDTERIIAEAKRLYNEKQRPKKYTQFLMYISIILLIIMILSNYK